MENKNVLENKNKAALGNSCQYISSFGKNYTIDKIPCDKFETKFNHYYIMVKDKKIGYTVYLYEIGSDGNPILSKYINEAQNFRTLDDVIEALEELKKSKQYNRYEFTIYESQEIKTRITNKIVLEEEEK